jgi:hypothetical protein
VSAKTRRRMAEHLSFVTTCGYTIYNHIYRVWSVDGKYWGELSEAEQKVFKAKLDEMVELLRWFSAFGTRLRKS